jgi:hypothetical protein
MLRKMLILTVAVCAAILLASGDALAWGCGSWSRSGSVSYTGRYGNTYTRSYSGSGYHYGRWGGYHYGGGYYGGGFRPGGFLAGYAAGAHNSQ